MHNCAYVRDASPSLDGLGSCGDVDEETNEEESRPDDGESHPERVLLVLHEVLLSLPLLLGILLHFTLKLTHFYCFTLEDKINLFKCPN